MCLSLLSVVLVERNPCKEFATCTVAPESIHQVDLENCIYRDSLTNEITFSPFFAIIIINSLSRRDNLLYDAPYHSSGSTHLELEGAVADAVADTSMA